MSSDRAGTPARYEDLVDVAHLVTAYYTGKPDPADVDQQVVFGTSGHRGSSLRTSFNEDHILATTQAIIDYRRAQGFDGPLFLARDTHALSEPAWATALEVLAGNDVTVMVDAADRYTPTPALSHAILRANRGKVSRIDDLTASGLADGIVVICRRDQSPRSWSSRCDSKRTNSPTAATRSSAPGLLASALNTLPIRPLVDATRS